MGKIGVFWVIDGEIDGYREAVENGECYGTTVQPTCDHYTFWDKLIIRYPALGLLEYDEIPRGRVVYDRKEKSFILLSSKEILKNAKLIEKICSFYELNKSNIKTRWDEHYELRDIDG